MADPLLFTLNIDQIFFDEESFPRYPTLFDYGIDGLKGLQPEPSLRKVEFPQGASGPFEIVFQLAEAEPARFAVSSEGELPVCSINNEPLLDTHWKTSVDSENRVCQLTWSNADTPPDHVLRLNCRLDMEPKHHPPLYLLFAFVNPQDLELRQTDSPLPLTSKELAFIELDKAPQSDHFFYPMYRTEAYRQLDSAFRFEPALRIRHGASLQFALNLSASTEIHFRRQPATPQDKDEVPVEMPANELRVGKSRFLEPTLYADPRSCIATWNQQQGEERKRGVCIAFHLEIEQDTPGDGGTSPLHIRRTVDPTIIEEPPAAPPVNGAYKDH